MKNPYLLVSWGYLTLSSLSASLMLSSEEVNILNTVSPIEDLNSLIEIQNVQNLPQSHLEEILFLSAILYFNSSHWTVWINSKTYTADDPEDENIKITKVTNSHIEFKLKNMGEKPTKLRSNQSLVTVSCRIVDGDARQKPSVSLL